MRPLLLLLALLLGCAGRSGRALEGRYSLGDPGEGLAPGTRWADIPDDWVCPFCGTAKADFDMIEL